LRFWLLPELQANSREHPQTGEQFVSPSAQ